MAENSEDLDVIIIGGGPGGLSAALWCADLGLKAVLIEKESEFGGQLLWTFNAIQNYLGIEAANGRELRDRFLKHVEKTKVHRLTGTPVVAADLTQKTVILADGKRYSAKTIIIATGVRRRKLGVPGEEEFRNRGILDSGVKSREEVSEKTVVIIGGGDAAVENALILSETASKVIVVHRRSEFTARKEFVNRLRRSPNIEVRFDTRVSAILGDETVEAVSLDDIKTGKQTKCCADNVLIRIGVVPNTEIFRGQISLDGSGYISVNANFATNLDGIYAAGDASNPLAPTISGAVGQAATAVKEVHRRFGYC